MTENWKWQMLRYGETRTPIHYQWECKIVQMLWERACSFLKRLKLKGSTTLWNNNSIVRYIPKKLKTGTQKDSCSTMFIAGLSIIVNQQRIKCVLCMPWVFFIAGKEWCSDILHHGWTLKTSCQWCKRDIKGKNSIYGTCMKYM
jgi:hypothetical protein